MTNKAKFYEGAAVWFGADLAHSKEWIYQLTPNEIGEIDANVQTILHRDMDIKDVRREDFPLRALGAVLADILNEVLHGRGFVLIKGLPVTRYSIKESAIAYWGIGTHLGEAVPQNAKGHLLGHVRDIGHDPFNPLHRVYATSYLLR